MHERPARVHDTRARYLGNTPSARNERSNECNEFEHELCARQRVCERVLERVLERVQRVRARVSKRVMLLPPVATTSATSDVATGRILHCYRAAAYVTPRYQCTVPSTSLRKESIDQ
jgi:hypothetical protein